MLPSLGVVIKREKTGMLKSLFSGKRTIYFELTGEGVIFGSELTAANFNRTNLYV